MSERHEDLSTADLADQQPTEHARPDLAEDADLPTREERASDDLGPDDVEPAQDPLAQDQGRASSRVAEDAGTTSTAGPLLASEDAEGFRARWTDVQTGFVDAPRQAVERADGLVAELMQHLARTFADERGRLESQWDRGDDVPTDDLRTAFQRYRSFFERLLAT
jgi:hypothetical protein